VSAKISQDMPTALIAITRAQKFKLLPQVFVAKQQLDELHQGPQGRERVLAAVAGARLNCPHSLDLSRASSTRMLV
jgi:hypothetical protein